MTNIRNVSQLVDHKHDLKKGDSFKIYDVKLYVTDAEGINKWRKAFQITNLGEAELLIKFNEIKDKYASTTEPEHHHHHHGHHHGGHHGHHHQEQDGTPPPSPRTEAAATTTTASATHTEQAKPTIVVTPPAEPTTVHSPRTEAAATTTATPTKPTTHAPTPPKHNENKPDNKKPASNHNFWDSFKSGGEKVKDFFFGTHNRTALTLITTAAIGCVLLTRSNYFQALFSKLMQNVKSHFGRQ